MIRGVSSAKQMFTSYYFEASLDSLIHCCDMEEFVQVLISFRLLSFLVT